MVRLTESRSSESAIDLMINVAQPFKCLPLLFYALPLRAFALFEIGITIGTPSKNEKTTRFFEKYEPHFGTCLKRRTKSHMLSIPWTCRAVLVFVIDHCHRQQFARCSKSTALLPLILEVGVLSFHV